MLQGSGTTPMLILCSSSDRSRTIPAAMRKQFVEKACTAALPLNDGVFVE